MRRHSVQRDRRIPSDLYTGLPSHYPKVRPVVAYYQLIIITRRIVRRTLLRLISLPFCYQSQEEIMWRVYWIFFPIKEKCRTKTRSRLDQGQQSFADVSLKKDCECDERLKY